MELLKFSPSHFCMSKGSTWVTHSRISYLAQISCAASVGKLVTKREIGSEYTGDNSWFPFECYESAFSSHRLNVNEKNASIIIIVVVIVQAHSTGREKQCHQAQLHAVCFTLAFADVLLAIRTPGEFIFRLHLFTCKRKSVATCFLNQQCDGLVQN